jgi:hypothetical protein
MAIAEAVRNGQAVAHVPLPSPFSVMIPESPLIGDWLNRLRNDFTNIKIEIRDEFARKHAEEHAQKEERPASSLFLIGHLDHVVALRAADSLVGRVIGQTVILLSIIYGFTLVRFHEWGMPWLVTVTVSPEVFTSAYFFGKRGSSLMMATL